MERRANSPVRRLIGAFVLVTAEKNIPMGSGIREQKLISLPSRSGRSHWHDSAPRVPIWAPPPPGFSSFRAGCWLLTSGLAGGGGWSLPLW